MLQYLVKEMPDKIDHKDEIGMTPLHCAFRSRLAQEAEVLINAGADQTIRTREGKNLVHLLLAKPWLKEVEEFTSLGVMLDLIDPRLMPSLFLERTTAAEDSQTPFALWAVGRRDYKKDTVDMARMLLSMYSAGAELDLVDGSGETPLHTATAHQSFEICQAILEMDPTLIHRENATGLTSYEMAENKMLARKFKAVETTSEHCRHRVSLVDQPHEDFVKTPNMEPSDEQKIWDLMRETKARLEASGEAQRKLVTLNEALEVARRLAANCARERPRKVVRIEWEG